MSDIKCPFCNLDIRTHRIFTDGCDNTHSPLWQELIRTRKALAFAKSKLNGIHRLYSKAFYTREDWLQVCMEMVDKANTALDKITALEQKE